MGRFQEPVSAVSCWHEEQPGRPASLPQVLAVPAAAISLPSKMVAVVCSLLPWLVLRIECRCQT